MIKKYTKFVIQLLSGDLLAKVFAFFTNIYLIRTLSNDSFGIYTTALSFLATASLMSDAGIRTLGFVEVASGNKQTYKLKELILAKICNSTILLIFFPLIIFTFYDREYLFFATTYLLLAVFTEIFLIDWYYKGIQKFSYVSGVRTAIAFLHALFAYLFITKESTLYEVITVFLIANLLPSLFIYFKAPKNTRILTRKFSVSIHRSILKASIPLGICSFLQQAVILFPPIFITKFVSEHASSLYGSAIKLVLLIMIIDRVFSTIFLSELPKQWSNDSTKTTIRLQHLVNLLLPFGGAIALMVMYVSPVCIPILFGDNYRESTPIMAIAIWFFSLTLLNTVFSYGLVAFHQKQAYLRAVYKSFTLYILAIVLLTYYFGLYGATIAVIVGEIAAVVFSFIEFRKFARISFIRPFILSITLLGVLIYLFSKIDIHLLIKALVVPCLFVGGSFILPIVSFNDITSLLKTGKTSTS